MRRPIKMDAEPAPTPENQRAFRAENGRAFRFTNPRRAGARVRIHLAHRKPDFLPASQKGRRHSRRPSSYADSLRQPGKTPVGHAETLRGGRAAPYSPCTPFTAPSISRAWARDASVASPESMRAISAGRSSADSRRRQVWGIPIVAGYLGDRIVHIAVHGNLGQVRHHDHLMAASQIGQDLGQRHGHGAAHAGVHLVEHQRVTRYRPARAPPLWPA